MLSAFLRVVTNPRIFARPTPFEQAVAFCSLLRTRGNAILVSPGPRHWGIFMDVCRRANAKGNVVPDAYLAALAIESGCSFATADRDFTRFADLELADVPT